MRQIAWLRGSGAVAAARQDAVLFPWLLSRYFQANSFFPRKGCGFCRADPPPPPARPRPQRLSCSFARAGNAAGLPSLHHCILTLKITHGCGSARCLQLCEPGCRQQQAARGCTSLQMKLYALKQGTDKPIFHSRNAFICLISAN